MSTKGTSSTVLCSATSTSARRSPTAGWAPAIFPSLVGAPCAGWECFSAGSEPRQSSATRLISRSISSTDVTARLRVVRLRRTWSLRKAQVCANLHQREVTSTCRRSRSARTIAASSLSARTCATSTSRSSSRGRRCRLQRPRCPLSLVQYPSRQHGFFARGSSGNRPCPSCAGGAGGAGCRCAKSLLSARWLVLPPSLAMCETTTPVIYRWLPESESFS
mmetsp:Transcript_25621/g.59312  ORF Transcript_25621/g.59312 Transcript_25621/m.59312 type:complete len:220 (-) Transcript_25621:60-719(-)